MSSVDVHPPQTYSRLFRPWDTVKFVPRQNDELTKAVRKQAESCKSVSKISESDRASNNSSKSSCDYDYHIAYHICQQQQEKGFRPDYGSKTPPSIPFAAHCSSLESNLLQFSVATGMPAIPSDYYYAAAAAAVSVQQTRTAAPFGMDPFSVSLMEQEYARVIAEDVHLKAINSRKQRPKKFKCPHCDVAFSNNGQLKGHIRIHTGERPFKCDVETCGKTFTRNEELTRHKRIHTGLRPYACNACGKKFGRRDHLKKHMKTHMPQERQLGPAIFVPMYPYLYGY